MARFYRWLVGHDYWLVYFVVYVGVMAGLAIWRQPNTLEKWSDIVTASIGVASGTAIVLEVIGMLLIKPTVEKLLKEGERRTLDRLERNNVITPEQRREAERDLERDTK